MTWWALLLSAWTATSTTSTVSPILRPPFGSTVPFTVEADRLIREGGIYVAEGKAVLRRAGAVVFADRIRFDEAKGVAVAEGNVTAVEGDSVLTCVRVEMKVPELIGGLESGEIRIKNDIPEPLLSRLSSQQLRRFGQDQMIVTADRMERVGARAFEVEGGSFTVCDCGEDSTPSWKIEASSASVDLDSGAWMYWPVFYAKGVPVFALPVFYFPLGERRSGLLTPRPSYSPVTGPSIAQPVYFVLGDSWDVTLEASYLSDRGPGAATELRWAPTVDSRGELRGSLIFDFGEVVGEQFDKLRTSPIPRYAIAARHRTVLEEHTSLNLDVNALGDPAYLGDFADDFLARQIEGTRSRLTISSFIQSNLRISGGLQLYQDLRPDFYAEPGVQLRQISLFSGHLNEMGTGPGSIRYRFAELRLDAPPYELIEEVPLLGEALARVHVFSAPRPEIARFLRADFRPGISLPLSILGLVTIEPSIAARITAWAGRFDGDGVDSNRAAFLIRASMYTSLWRDFGSIIHRIRPEISYLLIPKVWGSIDPSLFANDEIDQLASAMQLRARLVNDFIRPNGARIAGFEAWFGRDFDIPWEEEPGIGNSEVVLRADAPLTPSDWPVRIASNGRIAIDPKDGKVTDLAAQLGFNFPYVALGLAYEQLGDRVPAWPFVAPEELVPSGTIDFGAYVPLAEYSMRPLETKPWTKFRGMVASLQIRPIEALILSTAVSVTFDDPDELERIYGNRTPIRDTSSAISWISPCKCWSAGVVVTTARDRDHLPNVSFNLDLSRLGGGF